MISAAEQLKVPFGIEEPRAKAILSLAEARFGALPVERVLVYLVSNLPASALEALGWQFDIPSASWNDATPEGRVALISSAVARQRKRGTIRSALDAVASWGLPEAHVERHTVLVADGTLLADGTFPAGAYSHPGIYWLVLVSPELLTNDQQTKCHTALKDWMRGTAHLGTFCYVDSAEDFDNIPEYETATTVPVGVSCETNGDGTTITVHASRTLYAGGGDPGEWVLEGTAATVDSFEFEGRTLTLQLSGQILDLDDAVLRYVPGSICGRAGTAFYCELEVARSREPGHYLLREDGSYWLREDGTRMVREGV